MLSRDSKISETRQRYLNDCNTTRGYKLTFFSPPSPLPSHSVSYPLQCTFKIQLGGLEERRELPSGCVWGEAMQPMNDLVDTRAKNSRSNCHGFFVNLSRKNCNFLPTYSPSDASK